MSVLVPETPIAGRRLVATELRPHGVVDQFGQVVCNLDIGAEPEEYVAGLAVWFFSRQARQSQKFAMAPMQSSSGMRFLRWVSNARRSQGAARISTSVSDRSWRS